jgi:hypothetical protein
MRRSLNGVDVEVIRERIEVDCRFCGKKFRFSALPEDRRIMAEFFKNQATGPERTIDALAKN